MTHPLLSPMDNTSVPRQIEMVCVRRYYITRDDRVIAASEVGATRDPSIVKEKGRLQLANVRLTEEEDFPDEELKDDFAKMPYGDWLRQHSPC